MDINKFDCGSHGRACVAPTCGGDAHRPGFAILHQIHFRQRVRGRRRRAVDLFRWLVLAPLGREIAVIDAGEVGKVVAMNPGATG